MTREEVNRRLMHMEQLREWSYEADTRAEERRMTAEYGRMWKAIEPYVTGKKPYSDADGQDARHEGAGNG